MSDIFVISAEAAEAKKDAAPTLASQQQAAPGDQPPYELSIDKQLTDTLMFLVLLFGIFYFLLIRPQQKRVKDHQAMVDTLKKGSRIVTGGGIIATVTKLEGEEVAVVEIAPNVRIRITKDSIGEVLDDSKLPASTANDN